MRSNLMRTPKLRDSRAHRADLAEFRAFIQSGTERKSISYTYDRAGRTMMTKTKTTSGTSIAISHYAGPGSALTWTCEEVGECKEEKEAKWTRNIPGIDGALDAIQANGGAPVRQLHDLQGNIIAIAADIETENQTTEDTQQHRIWRAGGHDAKVLMARRPWSAVRT